jgi:hypothetical protein
MSVRWELVYCRAVVRGGAPPEFEVSKREDRKKNGESITISTPRFENLTTALYLSTKMSVV